VGCKIRDESRDPEHAPFRDDISSAGWDWLCSTYRLNLKSIDALSGGAKCRKLGSLGCFWVTQDHRQCRNSIKRIDFYPTLIETMHLSCTVFEIASYLSKVTNFSPPPAFGASVGVDPVDFRGDL